MVSLRRLAASGFAALMLSCSSSVQEVKTAENLQGSKEKPILTEEMQTEAQNYCRTLSLNEQSRVAYEQVKSYGAQIKPGFCPEYLLDVTFAEDNVHLSLVSREAKRAECKDIHKIQIEQGLQDEKNGQKPITRFHHPVSDGLLIIYDDSSGLERYVEYNHVPENNPPLLYQRDRSGRIVELRYNPSIVDAFTAVACTLGKSVSLFHERQK